MKNSKGYEENLYTPGCIRTNSGIYVNILDPKPEMFCIEDIAHALSRIPRFGGHLENHWSIAQHSIECCAMDIEENDRFTLLMHDCAEAYLGDMLSPIKRVNGIYVQMEHDFLIILSNKFGFNYPFSEEVKRIDKLQLEYEWDFHFLGNGYPSNDMDEVKQSFLDIFNMYNPHK